MPNSVARTSEKYEEMKDLWAKCRTFAKGQKAVHEEGETYLPKLSGQSTDQYEAYKMRTRLYNATGRTVQGLTGMITRKKPVVGVDEDPQMEEFLGDVTTSGQDFNSFTDTILDEVMKTGRAGVLTEYPKTENAFLTQAEAEARGLRPYWELYKAEQILDPIRVETINNQSKVTMIRLKQEVEIQDPMDEFLTKSEDEVLVLDLVNMDDGEGVRYRQRRYRLRASKNERGEESTSWEQVGDDIFPKVDGQFLDEIPFTFFGPKNNSPTIDKPPLIDLVDVNHDHYMKKADHSNALHIAGLPTPVISGHDTDDAIHIGTTQALVLGNPQAKAYYMELEGKSLDALKEELSEMKEEMAFLGARMLAPQKKQAEAAETAQIHQQGEQSVVASISNTTGRGLNRSLFHVARFYQSDAIPAVMMNTDFIPFPMDAPTLKALVQAWQEGALAWTDLINQLKRGEIIEEDRNPEDIKSEVQSERPRDLTNGQVL